MRLGALLRDLIEAAVLALVLFLVLQFALQNTIVEGSSMEPNLVDREWLLVSKIAYRIGEPQRGDVIVFHSPEEPEKDFIKRLIAFPGEQVEMREGRTLIDGELLDEPWAPAFDTTRFGPFAVPDGQFFVLGDNRARSNDSRSWNQGAGGGLAQDQVVGKAWVSVWPRETWGVVRADSPGPASGDTPETPETAPSQSSR